MAQHHLNIPLRNEDIIELKAGDVVYFSGEAWTCNTQLQSYLFEKKQKLPFSTAERNVIIHAAPVVIKTQEGWKVTSFMPGASIRFEKWGEACIEKFGLKAIIGRTTMGAKTLRAMVSDICIHCTTIGVPGQQYLGEMEVVDVYLHDELGEVEAAWLLKLKDLGPFLVDIDTKGNSYFDMLDPIIEGNKRYVYTKLGIPKDFEFTKLY